MSRDVNATGSDCATLADPNETETNETEIFPVNAFEEMNLAPAVLEAVVEAGYTTPSDIQEETIPIVLAGLDMIGQAETGSGKTAAFALPLLSRIDATSRKPQVLVLAPTRELAIQVTESFEKYAGNMEGFRAVTIYGGQNYDTQIRALNQGVQVVVGTPGRVMDHLRRETLDLSHLKTFVLDEADEMLRMGFIDDIEWICQQIPQERQTVMFSATMPDAIRRIARQHLRNPKHVTIQSRTATADSITQRHLMVLPRTKMESLDRLLQTEEPDGTLVFTKTRTTTIVLAEYLNQRGYRVAALNGDIPQAQRERTVNQLKSGRLDVVIATDVAARGLDVDRISLVVNYDFPHDTEAYIHRIGRTGRAGREGLAVLFVEPREKGKFSRLQRATNQKIDALQQKSLDEVNNMRVQKFLHRVDAATQNEQAEMFGKILARHHKQSGKSFEEIAAGLAVLAQGDVPLILKEMAAPKASWKEGRGDRGGKRDSHRSRRDDSNMVTYRVEVGRTHGVGPGNLVGAITNEAGLTNASIGRINIQQDFSTIDLPSDLPRATIEMLGEVVVSGQRLQIKRDMSGGRYERRPRYGKKNNGSTQFAKQGKRRERNASADGDSMIDRADGRKPKSFRGKSKSSFAKPSGKPSFAKASGRTSVKSSGSASAKRRAATKRKGGVSSDGGPVRKYVKIRSAK